MGASTSSLNVEPDYEVVTISTGGPVTVLRRDGTRPAFLVGFVNLAATAQAVSMAVSDYAGVQVGLPQVGQLAATQAVSMVLPGIRLFNGLIATASAVPTAPGIAVLVR